MSESITPADLLSETEVYERFGKCLVNRELRLARKRGQIGWYDLRAGPHYSVAQVMDYLKLMERKPCPTTNDPLNDNVEEMDDCSPLATSGLAGKPVAIRSTNTGMTPELEELAARRLERMT